MKDYAMRLFDTFRNELNCYDPLKAEGIVWALGFSAFFPQARWLSLRSSLKQRASPEFG